MPNLYGPSFRRSEDAAIYQMNTPEVYCIGFMEDNDGTTWERWREDTTGETELECYVTIDEKGKWRAGHPSY